MLRDSEVMASIVATPEMQSGMQREKHRYAKAWPASTGSAGRGKHLFVLLETSPLGLSALDGLHKLLFSRLETLLHAKDEQPYLLDVGHSSLYSCICRRAGR